MKVYLQKYFFDNFSQENTDLKDIIKKEAMLVNWLIDHNFCFNIIKDRKGWFVDIDNNSALLLQLTYPEFLAL